MENYAEPNFMGINVLRTENMRDHIKNILVGLGAMFFCFLIAGLVYAGILYSAENKLYVLAAMIIAPFVFGAAWVVGGLFRLRR